MNKYITSSIFMAAGLSTVSAAALDAITDMRGSDTLFNVTNQAINNCGAACVGHITYLGTGSGNGESAIYTAPEKQSIAPMSKFLGTTGCGAAGVSALASSTATTPTVYTQAQVEANACGLVLGLDAVSIYSSVYTGGSPACNDASYCDNITYPGTLSSGQTCSQHDHPTTNANKGLAYGGAINWAAGLSPTYGPASGRDPNLNMHAYGASPAGGYVIQNWTEVLRIIYTGIDNTGCQDCESDVRNGLVNNWGLIFKAGAGSCAGSATGGPTCTQLRHAFRRDDQSGTTETFLLLIGAPGVTKNAGFLKSVGTTDPFCNSAQERQTSAFPTGATTLAQTGTIKYFEHGTKTVNGSQVPNPPAEAYINPNANDAAPDFRDRDPIRRPCAGVSGNVQDSQGNPPNEPTEQVCDIDGKLGVVLPIIATDSFPAGHSFPTNACATGKFRFAPTPPQLADGNLATASGPCPNGAVLAAGCLVPVDSSNDPNCMPNATSQPSGFGTAVPLMVARDTGNAVEVATTTASEVLPGAIDGRTYALQAYQITGSSVSYVLDNTLGAPSARALTTPTAGRAVSGMFTRIHTSRSMNLVDPQKAACQFVDATEQLGCLVQADECSLSYAGATAENAAPIGYLRTASAMLVNGKGAIAANLNGSFTYPLGRKLYLNTYIGFGNVWGPELALAKDEASATFINPILTPLGFFPLAGGTFYEDYNETMLCSVPLANASNGCANDPLQIGGTPVVTQCGDPNNTIDQYEDCDDGATANVGSCPTTNAGQTGNPTAFRLCNQTCRFAYCFTPPGGVAAGNLSYSSTGNTGYCPTQYRVHL